MSRVVVVNKTIKDEKLKFMFEQMTGAKDPDPEIIMPKFINIRRHSLVITKTLDKFANNDKLLNMFPTFNKYFSEISNYSSNLYNSMNHELLDADIKLTEIASIYKKLKDDQHVRAISVMCARLRKDMTLINDQNIYFIGNQPDDTYTPFPFSHLNLTHIWTEAPPDDEGGLMIKKYIMAVLKKLMEKSYEIHNILISPDIDIDEFSESLVEAISMARVRLPRCKQAFDKIEESLNLLKNNFGDYYKSYMISKNPNSILESFIVDVAQKQKGDLKLKWQFMQIVNLYRKEASDKIAKDPDLKYVFDTIDSKIDDLGKATDEPDSYESDSKSNANTSHIEIIKVLPSDMSKYRVIGSCRHNNKTHLSVIDSSRYDELIQDVSGYAMVPAVDVRNNFDEYSKKLSKSCGLHENHYQLIQLNDFSKEDWKTYHQDLKNINGLFSLKVFNELNDQFIAIDKDGDKFNCIEIWRMPEVLNLMSEILSVDQNVILDNIKKYSQTLEYPINMNFANETDILEDIMSYDWNTYWNKIT